MKSTGGWLARAAVTGVPFPVDNFELPRLVMLAIGAVSLAYLTELPVRPSGESCTDALLPVAGSTMSALVRVLRVFREQRETVLVCGPTESGKSRLARWCHQTDRKSVV